MIIFAKKDIYYEESFYLDNRWIVDAYAGCM